MAWKRPVEGIREMCDSCNTTLFNVHWTCKKCGHAVCLDCYTSLRRCSHSADGERCKSCTRIAHRCCVRRRQHSVADLMPTQIIPTDGRLLYFDCFHLWACHCWFYLGFLCQRHAPETGISRLVAVFSGTSFWYEIERSSLFHHRNCAARDMNCAMWCDWSESCLVQETVMMKLRQVCSNRWLVAVCGVWVAGITVGQQSRVSVLQWRV